MKQPATNEAQSRQSLTLGQFVEQRNGVPLGHPESLKNMLRRSFGGASFAEFWQYWNPIWGYGLGRFVYDPCRKILPAAASVLMTFIISGLLHDLVTMLLRQAVTFLFTPWFFLLGLGVLLSRLVEMDLSTRPFWQRAGVNFAYLAFCLALTLLLKRALGIP